MCRFTSVVQFHYVYSLSRGSERTQHKNFTFFFQLNKLTMSSNSTFLSFFACSSPPGFKDHAKSFRLFSFHFLIFWVCSFFFSEFYFWNRNWSSIDVHMSFAFSFIRNYVCITNVLINLQKLDIHVA